MGVTPNEVTHIRFFTYDPPDPAIAGEKSNETASLAISGTVIGNSYSYSEPEQ